MLKVLMLNDQVTPMAFAVSVLRDVFGQSKEEAERTALFTHAHGEVVCGIYQESAEANNAVTSAIEFSRRHSYPLDFVIRPVPLWERVGWSAFRMIMKVLPRIHYGRESVGPHPLATATEPDPKLCSCCAATGWVCEEHPDRAWKDCDCRGTGMPCPICNASAGADDPPDVSRLQIKPAIIRER
jgi:ATP-dependent Clp protease adapter protein ClpS